MAPDILRVFFGLIAVIGLIGATAIFARKMGLVSASSVLTRKRRLSVVETLAIDPRRKLLIIQCDNKEHLILLGHGGETIIDSDLENVVTAEEEAHTSSSIVPSQPGGPLSLFGKVAA